MLCPRSFYLAQKVKNAPKEKEYIIMDQDKGRPTEVG
jgi:hypothetical protein